MMNIGKTRLALLSTVSIAAFENRAGWKLDADGKIEMRNGNPVWIDANGGEAEMGGDTISRLNGEAKTLRTRAENAEKALKPFEGLEAEAARKALETVSKIDAKTLIDAGEVDKVRNTIKSEYDTQIGERDKKYSDLESRYNRKLVDDVFNTDFMANVAMPRDFFVAAMRDHFKVEDGGVKAYDRNGNPLMSKRKVGEYADTSEALELLVDMHPQKETILRANPGGGSGNGGGGGARGGGRFISRSDFDKLNPAQQAETAAKQSTGEITITD
jgi:hypothetical protein